jgi:hypothetical protein
VSGQTVDPGAPPSPLARLLVSVLMVVAYLAWDRTQAWRVHVNPDSRDYVRNEETRGWVYPLLIDLTVARSHQEVPDTWGREVKTAPAFERLVLVQRVIVLLVLWFSSVVVSRRGVLVPLAMVAGAAVLDSLLGRDMSQDLRYWTGAINPEALAYPWVTILFLLTWSATESPSRLRLLALGVWAALGVDLAARLLPFCVLTLAPAAGAWIGRKSGTRVAPALLALGTCAALVGLRCAATYARYEAFAPVPFNGFSTIGMALQFADANDERLFDDRREKDFLGRCLGDRRRCRSDPVQGRTFEKSFVNTNTWVIAWPVYKEIWSDPGTDPTAGNRVLADIARKLLFSDGDNFRRWMSWAGRAYAESIATRWPISIAGLASLATALLLRRRAPPPILALLLVLPIAHVANILVTVTLQGILPRYILTSEFLLLGAFAVLAAQARSATRTAPPATGSPASGDLHEHEATPPLLRPRGSGLHAP